MGGNTHLYFQLYESVDEIGGLRGAKENWECGGELTVQSKRGRGETYDIKSSLVLVFGSNIYSIIFSKNIFEKNLQPQTSNEKGQTGDKLKIKCKLQSMGKGLEC